MSSRWIGRFSPVSVKTVRMVCMLLTVIGLAIISMSELRADRVGVAQ